MIYNSFQLKPPRYGDYEYPSWALAIGWISAMCTVIPIPAYFVYAICKEEGHFTKVGLIGDFRLHLRT